MSLNVAESRELLANPVEVAEQVVAAHDLPFERFSADDLAAEYAGSWCAYQLWFAFRQDIQALHFSCGFDVRVPLERRETIYPLLARINEQLWLGHFDLWTEEGQRAVSRRTAAQLWPNRRHDRDRGGRMRAILPSLPARHLGRQERR
jgi:hypothetical protein